MRAACNLDKVSPPTSIDIAVIVEEYEKREPTLFELTDALAVVALGRNADIQRIAPSIGILWGEMASPNPVDAPSGGYDVPDDTSIKRFLLAYGYTAELRGMGTRRIARSPDVPGGIATFTFLATSQMGRRV